ncbi:hypothetical protein JTB14_035498 [Gonioctena quinquepunctata]|nr:hypothetical protein JTB14_035498 [Gonioctena quinquepunctata]
MSGGSKRKSKKEVHGFDDEKYDFIKELTEWLQRMDANLIQNNQISNENFPMLSKNFDIKGSLEEMKFSDRFSPSSAGKHSDRTETVNEELIFPKDFLNPQAREMKNTCNSNFFSGWKELGGGSVLFRPADGTYPVMFINEISSFFREAHVPENKQLSSVMGALRESAADWREMDRHSCRNLGEFKTIFLDRYWDTHTRRKAYRKLKFGINKRGY